MALLSSVTAPVCLLVRNDVNTSADVILCVMSARAHTLTHTHTPAHSDRVGRKGGGRDGVCVGGLGGLGVGVETTIQLYCQVSVH